MGKDAKPARRARGRRAPRPAPGPGSKPPPSSPEPPSRAAAWIAAGLGAIGAAAFFDAAVAGSDLWWHLASGREIWDQGGIPAVDPFSYSFGGRPWMNHEWLWDALYWGLYAFHPQLVPWTQLAVLTGTYLLVCQQCLALGRSPAAAVLATWAAAASAHWFLDLRPHVWTLALTAGLLHTRAWRARVALWPLAMAAWANLHAGFVFGFGAVGLLATVHTARDSLRAGSWRVPRRDWLVVGLCAGAALLNPWGWRILEYPLAYLPGVAESAYHQLVEWRPTGFGLEGLETRGLWGWLGTFQARFWLLAAAAGLGSARGLRRDPYRVALAAVAGLMALRSRRFIPLFGVCAAPLAALGIAGALGALRVALPAGVRASLRSGRGAALAAGAGALGAALLWRGGVLTPDLLGRWTQRDRYPQAAVRYLNALGPPQRVLNHYNWGGYLALHAPRAQVFIDGRANTVYDDAILRDYSAMLGGAPDLRARIAKYPAPDVALLPPGAFATALQRPPGAWKRIYADPESVLLAPPGSPLRSRDLPDPAVLLAEEPQFLRQRAAVAWARGAPQRAQDWVERALAIDPLELGAYIQLARIRLQQGDRAGMREALGRGVRALPRRAAELLQAEGVLLARSGELEPAIHSLRRALPTGPFAGNAHVSARIRMLRQLIERRERRARHGPSPTAALATRTIAASKQEGEERRR